MSKSPHRLRGDAAECWSAILFGEIVRLVDQPVTVAEQPTIRLPKTGRWESGLAQVRPALDDALGDTAFAVAWRWACAEREANAWPGLPLIASKATDHPVAVGRIDALAVFADGSELLAGGDTAWRLSLADGSFASIAVRGPHRDWVEIDRVAGIVAAWLDRPWTRVLSAP